MVVFRQTAVQAHWLRRARPEVSGLGSAKADQNPYPRILRLNQTIRILF